MHIFKNSHISLMRWIIALKILKEPLSETFYADFLKEFPYSIHLKFRIKLMSKYCTFGCFFRCRPCRFFLNTELNACVCFEELSIEVSKTKLFYLNFGNSPFTTLIQVVNNVYVHRREGRIIDLTMIYATPVLKWEERGLCIHLEHVSTEGSRSGANICAPM